MAALSVRITRRVDGGVVLRCERADGTATWQRVDGHQAAFFPRHDLTHYAVESELSFREGFFGLIAAGWDIDDTAGKGRRGKLPPEAVVVEHLVGALDLERATGVVWSADDLNAHLGAVESGPDRPKRAPLTDQDLDRVRDRLRRLFAEWAAVAAGDSLELAFDRPAHRSAGPEAVVAKTRP
jgi:hypothetical protein